MIPKLVADAFRALTESGVAEIAGGLEPCAVTGDLKFKCRLPVPQPNPENLPPEAGFEVILPATFPHRDPSFVSVDPAVQWFWHQSADGTICLSQDRVYPSNAAERLLAFVQGAIGWLSDAASQRLAAPGDAWELPDFRTDSKGPPLLFLESPESFAAWSPQIGQAGQVDLAGHARARGLVGVRFYDEGALVAAPPVSAEFCDASCSSPAEWVLLPAFVLERNRRPSTFEELAELADRAGVDMWQRLHRAFKRPAVAGYRYLLVGAPIPTSVGEPAVEVHWQAIALPDALRRSIFVRGARREGLFRRQQIRRALERREVPWTKSSNLAPGRLLKRGSLVPVARERRVCILGCGAIGAPLAAHLARGGAQNLSLFDGENVDSENLVRHPLAPADVGRNKAMALARRLAGIHPTATITGFSMAVPVTDLPVTEEARRALDEADVIIDCTANDLVLGWASEVGRRQRKLVISVYLNAGATMLTVVASGRHASCRQVEKRLRADIERDAAPFSRAEHDGLADEVRVGAGCWSATFPAADWEVAALVAHAVPIIEKLMARQPRSHGVALVIKRREIDDSLELGPLAELVLQRDYR